MKLNFYIKVLALIYSIVGHSPSVMSQGKLILSQQMVDAYNEISALRIQDGKRILKESGYIASNNYMGFYIENYIDFFTLFIQEGQRGFSFLFLREPCHHSLYLLLGPLVVDC